MTKSTITRDELNEVIATYGKHHIAHRMANVLLAAMESEPVAEITEDLGRLFVKIHYPTTLKAGDKLYRHAQPAPVVPDEVTAEDCPAFVEYEVAEVDDAWSRGFNACRAAMLNGGKS